MYTHQQVTIVRPCYIVKSVLTWISEGGSPRWCCARKIKVNAVALAGIRKVTVPPPPVVFAFTVGVSVLLLSAGLVVSPDFRRIYSSVKVILTFPEVGLSTLNKRTT